MELLDEIKEIKDKFKLEIESASNRRDLERIELYFLGRKSRLGLILRQLKDLPESKRQKLGQAANSAKLEMKQVLAKRLADWQRRESGQMRSRLELTWPGSETEIGHRHPLRQFTEKVEDIFISMGFEILDGPQIESAKYNFDLLNIPKDHPARDMWDTFYLENNLVLRTHTSPMQIRAMETRKPPVRLIVPGRTFRHEATDASHETNFYQVEGLVIDRCISVANLLATVDSFFKALYGPEVKIKPHGSYFPFTEPSLEISMSCLICGGRGCPVCQRSGWLEMMGAGMVHPRVLENMNVDPDEFSGFAFGVGLDRLMMLYHQINDIRLSYKGKISFSKQF